ncbi:MAG: hypothetical protein CVU03_08300 [Bacteroidetes bacterium HGW-Bacteroidetes-2]|jgi:hypothetical protein|nr:MAG: hypothetical protein CVU03_08300 [Bacteroidetes bacterium HGW-Bacteroidetes-2]
MKPLKNVFLFMLFAFVFYSCETEENSPEPEPEEIQVNQISIIPSSNLGRPNTNLGCIEISSRITNIEVWDHQTIDGDIISIIANGQTIIDQQTLNGPSNPISTSYDFGFNGFNYLTLYAHNLGDIPPNTATIAINGVEFVLEANLDANGSIDVIISGYGVDCGDAQGGGGSGGGASPTGDIIFWTGQDFGCGPITVFVESVGTNSITGFFSSPPNCSDTGAGGNFNNLPVGTYNFTASCSSFTWSGSFSITENGCLRFQLT